jgi:endonuclease/exonuclease/phosphatase family metal-dependent hydrolase
MVLASLAAVISMNLAPANTLQAQQPETLRVMTFNIWVGGESGKQPFEQTAFVIQRAQADIVGLQEVCGENRNGQRPDNAQRIAQLLNMEYFSQGDDDSAVMTRHKITGHTPRKWGVEVELPSGRRVWLFNVHFIDAPYQPYQLLDIPYGEHPFLDTAEEAVASAHAARHKAVESMLAEVSAVREANPNAAIFVTGDFNEPSEHDWTVAAQAAGLCPLAVRWPTTASIHAEGFIDAYRAVHPDPVAKPGNTWTPLTTADDPQDHHDRIDLVLVGAAGAKIENVDVVGEDAAHADIVVAPYPSDHRAVVAKVTLP